MKLKCGYRGCHHLTRPTWLLAGWRSILAMVCRKGHTMTVNPR